MDDIFTSLLTNIKKQQEKTKELIEKVINLQEEEIEKIQDKKKELIEKVIQEQEIEKQKIYKSNQPINNKEEGGNQHLSQNEKEDIINTIIHSSFLDEFVFPHETNKLYLYLINKKIIKNREKFENCKKCMSKIEHLSYLINNPEFLHKYYGLSYDEYLTYYHKKIKKAEDKTKIGYQFDCSKLYQYIKSVYKDKDTMTLKKLISFFYSDQSWINTEHYFYVIAVTKLYIKYFCVIA